MFAGAIMSLNGTYWIARVLAGVPSESMGGWFRFHFTDPFVLLGPGYLVSGVVAGILPDGPGYTILAALVGVVVTVLWTLVLSNLAPEQAWIQEGLMWFCSPFWLPPVAIVSLLILLFRSAVAAHPRFAT